MHNNVDESINVALTTAAASTVPVLPMSPVPPVPPAPSDNPPKAHESESGRLTKLVPRTVTLVPPASGPTGGLTLETKTMPGVR